MEQRRTTVITESFINKLEYSDGSEHVISARVITEFEIGGLNGREFVTQPATKVVQINSSVFGQVVFNEAALENVRLLRDILTKLLENENDTNRA